MATRPEPRRSAAGSDGRRRAAVALTAAGALLVVVALAALVAGLAGNGDDDAGAASPAGPARTAALVDRRMGVALRHPRTWRRDADRRAVRLAAPDRRLGLSITTVRSRPAVAEVRSSVERSVVQTFAQARVLRRFGGRMGGRPARLTAIAARNARGERLDVLLGVVASRWRTYAVVAFGSPAAPPELLRQAEAVLASLQFRRPGR